MVHAFGEAASFCVTSSNSFTIFDKAHICIFYFMRVFSFPKMAPAFDKVTQKDAASTNVI